MKRIVDLKLKKLTRTLMENNKMALTYAPEVVDQITARCTEVETGARNIEFILNGNVLPQLSQTILARMAEGGMTQVVGQADGFDQILVELQGPGDRAAQLGHLQRMRQPRAEQVAFMVDEDLGLVDQAAERGGMDDAVAVALEGVARGRRRAGVQPTARLGGVAGVGGQGDCLFSQTDT